MRFKGNRELFMAFLLIVFYLFTRLYHLNILPVFCDEAIYIRWAQIMKSVPSLWSVPLSDGKQPLFMWFVVPLLGFFSNPLFAGRLVSVLAGLFTMIGAGVLSWLVFRKREISFYTMILYLFVPFGLFFDRMALVDSLLCFFITWSFVFAVWLGKTGRFYFAILLGASLGAGWLTKSPAMIFVAILPLTALVIRIAGERQSKKTRGLKMKEIKEWTYFFFLLLTAVFLAFFTYNLLRLAPEFYMIALRNKDYVWPFSELLRHPLDPLLPHLKDVWRYYHHYATWPVFILGLLGIVFSFREKATRLWGAVLLVVWVTPLILEAAVAKVFTARYILFGLPVFLVFVGYGLWVGSLIMEKVMQKMINKSWSRKWLVGIGMVVVLIPSLYFDWQLWRNPSLAPLPKDEYAGYLEDWTAGWGIKESADYLKELPRDRNITVGTEGFFGTLPEGLQIYLERERKTSSAYLERERKTSSAYLEGEKKIVVIGVGLPIKTVPEPLVNAKKADDRVYLVVNESRMVMENQEGLSLIDEYEKPGGDKLLFFEVLD